MCHDGKFKEEVVVAAEIIYICQTVNGRFLIIIYNNTRYPEANRSGGGN